MLESSIIIIGAVTSSWGVLLFFLSTKVIFSILLTTLMFRFMSQLYALYDHPAMITHISTYIISYNHSSAGSVQRLQVKELFTQCCILPFPWRTEGRCSSCYHHRSAGLFLLII